MNLLYILFALLPLSSSFRSGNIGSGFKSIKQSSAKLFSTTEDTSIEHEFAKLVAQKVAVAEAQPQPPTLPQPTLPIRRTGPPKLNLVDSDSLAVTPFMIKLVTSTLFGHLFITLSSIFNLYSSSSSSAEVSTTTLTLLATLLGAYLTADLGSGVLHWSTDNYGSKKTPLFGVVIDAFQGE